MSLFDNSSPVSNETERLPLGFFAYAASPPMIPSAINAAIQSVNKSQIASLRSWEELRVSGKFIISEICAAIEQADFLSADVTGINPNVMYEIGYEIEGLVRLFSKYKEQDFKGYVVESLWKFMLYTELARAAAEQAGTTTLWDLTNEDTRELVDLLAQNNVLILVENGITIPELESVLFEFVGVPSILTRPEVEHLVSKAKIPAVIEHLLKLNFLGVETAESRFSYSDEPRALKKLAVLSDRYISIHLVSRRYEISNAFRSYLEITES